jgi:hypothetical protein
MRVPLLRNLLIGVAVLGGSYLAAGLVNAPTIVQPRITSTYRSGTVIVIAPEEDAPQTMPSTLPADDPQPASASLRAL